MLNLQYGLINICNTKFNEHECKIKVSLSFFTFLYSYFAFPESLGTLSNVDDDSSRNITEKMNLRPFKLYHVYLEPLNSSNVGDFPWSWIIKGFIHVQIEKGKFVVVCPRPPQNDALAGFLVVVVRWTSQEMC